MKWRSRGESDTYHFGKDTRKDIQKIILGDGNKPPKSPFTGGLEGKKIKNIPLARPVTEGNPVDKGGLGGFERVPRNTLHYFISSKTMVKEVSC